MLTLGIETSCDETSASVVRDGKDILSNTVASSLDLHKKYGGVVPEIACRHHLECIDYVIKEALDAGKVNLSEIELVAVTHGPGLTGALLIGVSVAKALSCALSIPLVGVNHLYAHIYSAMMNPVRNGISNGVNGVAIKFPCVGFVVSGGHTILVLVSDYNKIKLLGQTRDDAAGEAFDKTAKVLNLGYPGGPAIERKAKAGDSGAIDFPRAYLEKGSFDFSFSGVKTALLYYVRDGENNNINNICASFQRAIFDVMVDKAIDACIKNEASQLLVGGGVSINETLREMLKNSAKDKDIEVLFPGRNICTDNAAMVAAAGYRLYKEGVVSDYSLDAEPNLSLG